jgi:hypothetical protein
LKRALGAIGVGALIAALAGAAPAAAQTRAEFSASADSICKRQSDIQMKALKREFRKLRGRHGRRVSDFLHRDGLYDLHLAKAIDNSQRQISALPPPPGDETMVAQWLDSFHWDAVNARDAGRIALRKRVHFGRYFKTVEQASVHNRATDLLIDGFGMRVCASNTHYSVAVSAGSYLTPGP